MFGAHKHAFINRNACDERIDGFFLSLNSQWQILGARYFVVKIGCSRFHFPCYNFLLPEFFPARNGKSFLINQMLFLEHWKNSQHEIFFICWNCFPLMFDHFRFCLPKFCGCVPVDERDGRASEKYQKEFECSARNIATAKFCIGGNIGREKYAFSHYLFRKCGCDTVLPCKISHSRECSNNMLWLWIEFDAYICKTLECGRGGKALEKIYM